MVCKGGGEVCESSGMEVIKQTVTVLQHLFAKITQGAESFGLPPLAFEVTEAGTAEAATR